MDLRKVCACGCRSGRIETRGGQDCVFCTSCGKWQYNAPKTETGRKERSVSTTHQAIKPKLRERIIERANGRCERCGKLASQTSTGIHVGHVISVVDGHKYGLTDAEINSEENLLAECDECNLGHGEGSLPIRFHMALLQARLAKGGA